MHAHAASSFNYVKSHEDERVDLEYLAQGLLWKVGKMTYQSDDHHPVITF